MNREASGADHTSASAALRRFEAAVENARRIAARGRNEPVVPPPRDDLLLQLDSWPRPAAARRAAVLRICAVTLGVGAVLAMVLGFALAGLGGPRPAIPAIVELPATLAVPRTLVAAAMRAGSDTGAEWTSERNPVLGTMIAGMETVPVGALDILGEASQRAVPPPPLPDGALRADEYPRHGIFIPPENLEIGNAAVPVSTANYKARDEGDGAVAPDSNAPDAAELDHRPAPIGPIDQAAAPVLSEPVEDERLIEARAALERERKRADTVAGDLASLRAEIGMLREQISSLSNQARDAETALPNRFDWKHGAESWQGTTPRFANGGEPVFSFLAAQDLRAAVGETTGMVEEPVPGPGIDPHEAASEETLASVGAPSAEAEAAVRSTGSIDRRAAEPWLLQRAQELLKAQDIGGARLILERAAESGDAEAAFLLAETYDQRVLSIRYPRASIRGDAGKARHFYGLAHEGGFGGAEQRMEASR